MDGMATINLSSLWHGFVNSFILYTIMDYRTVHWIFCMKQIRMQKLQSNSMINLILWRWTSSKHKTSQHGGHSPGDKQQGMINLSNLMCRKWFSFKWFSLSPPETLEWRHEQSQLTLRARGSTGNQTWRIIFLYTDIKTITLQRKWKGAIQFQRKCPADQPYWSGPSCHPPFLGGCHQAEDCRIQT